MPLHGHAALVTGASRGLGLGIARALAAAGAEVWAVAEDGPELERACAAVEGPGQVHALVVDLRRRDEAVRAVEAVRRARPDLTVLVNNAAVLPIRPLAETDDLVWDEVLAVNLTAPFTCMREALPLLRIRGGSIINVSSRAGVTAFADEAAYCATKFGVEGLTRAAALELAGLGISVNTVTPGARIKPTGLDERAFDAWPAESRAGYRDPATFAPAIAVLAQLRGRPSGLRFDLARLTDAVQRLGAEVALAQLASLAEGPIPTDPD
jgi:NAD(P)-dependent dehydrogenase (short-subunit alcohol dehydrogenase family)